MKYLSTQLQVKCLKQNEMLQLIKLIYEHVIFCVQTGTIIDWDVVVNILAVESSRKVVLKNNMEEIDMHKTVKVN